MFCACYGLVPAAARQVAKAASANDSTVSFSDRRKLCLAQSKLNLSRSTTQHKPGWYSFFSLVQVIYPGINRVILDCQAGI